MEGADPEIHPIHSLDTNARPWRPRFYATWMHAHGVTQELDPTFDATDHYTARSPYRDRVDPESGLRVAIHFYDGSESAPFEIGWLRITSWVDSPNATLKRELSAAIQEILESERADATASLAPALR
jgi:hypothetical protein